MKLTIIESPFAGTPEHSEKEHRDYLDRCIKDSIDRGESPYASHKMLVDSLDDSDPEQRKIGIEAGLAWGTMANIIVFYLDYGWSSGMENGLCQHVWPNKVNAIKKLVEHTAVGGQLRPNLSCRKTHQALVFRKIGKNPTS